MQESFYDKNYFSDPIKLELVFLALVPVGSICWSVVVVVCYTISRVVFIFVFSERNSIQVSCREGRIRVTGNVYILLVDYYQLFWYQAKQCKQ